MRWPSDFVNHVLCGDCLQVMRDMPDNCIDTVITDPPYGLKFMGKDWDHGIPGVRFWAEILRVAKPGAICLAFGGTRTYHRLVCAIEDAGWEIRDCIMWIYGSGFPKSLDISKAIDKMAGAEREVTGRHPNYCEGRKQSWGFSPDKGWNDNENGHDNGTFATSPTTDAAKLWDGWGTVLKPAYEPICVAMKPLDGTFAQNALKHGVAGLNIDGGRIETDWNTDPTRRGWQGGNSRAGYKGLISIVPGDGKNRVSHPNNKGRWPANIIHDGSEEVVGKFPENRKSQGGVHFNHDGFVPAEVTNRPIGYGDNGSAARFFYCAKASRKERNEGLEGMERFKQGAAVHGFKNGSLHKINTTKKDKGPSIRIANANNHPTVKPLALMEYLCRLTATPTGGVILDPFLGSGTTAIAAKELGRDFIGIDSDPDSCRIAEARLRGRELFAVDAISD